MANSALYNYANLLYDLLALVASVQFSNDSKTTASKIMSPEMVFIKLKATGILFLGID